MPTQMSYTVELVTKQSFLYVYLGATRVGLGSVPTVAIPDPGYIHSDIFYRLHHDIFPQVLSLQFSFTLTGTIQTSTEDLLRRQRGMAVATEYEIKKGRPALLSTTAS